MRLISYFNYMALHVFFQKYVASIVNGKIASCYLSVFPQIDWSLRPRGAADDLFAAEINLSALDIL